MRLHKAPGALLSVPLPRSWQCSGRLLLLGQLLLLLGGVLTWSGPNWADWMWKLELLSWNSERGLVLLFLSRLLCPAAALLASVSLAGPFLLPALLLCRGAALCGTAAHIVSTAPDHAFFLSFFLAGLPAVFTLPPLLIQWAEGIRFSRSLLHPAGGGFPGRGTGVLSAFFLSCLAACACIFLERTVIPVLVSLV